MIYLVFNHLLDIEIFLAATVDKILLSRSASITTDASIPTITLATYGSMEDRPFCKDYKNCYEYLYYGSLKIYLCIPEFQGLPAHDAVFNFFEDKS